MLFGVRTPINNKRINYLHVGPAAPSRVRAGLPNPGSSPDKLVLERSLYSLSVMVCTALDFRNTASLCDLPLGRSQLTLKPSMLAPPACVYIDNL
jgi:hypothetical protein